MRDHGCGLMLAVEDALTHDVRQVLVQCPSAGDVEHLHAAADRQQRQASGVGRLGKRQLEHIQPALRRSGERVPSPAVADGIEIGAARKGISAVTLSSRGSMHSSRRGGTTTGKPPAASIACRYFSPSAISCTGGSPWGVRTSISPRLISDVVTAIRGAA